MISKFAIQKHFSGSRDFVGQPQRMGLLLLVGGDVILTGSEARIWKKGTVHCILLSSGWSGGESLTCGPPISGIAPNHPLESSAVVCKNSVQPVGLRDPHARHCRRESPALELALSTKARADVAFARENALIWRNIAVSFTSASPKW
jgi:hypothetical protein